MSQSKAPVTEVQKTEAARQSSQESARQPEQGVAPQAAYRRAQVSRSGLRPADLLALQRTVGNRGVQWMVAQRGYVNHQQLGANAQRKQAGMAQGKLTVGAPDNIYEQEATLVVNQGTWMPETESLTGRISYPLHPHSIQRMSSQSAKKLQRQPIEEAESDISRQKLETVNTKAFTPATKQIQRADRVEPSLPMPAGEQGPPSPLTSSACVPTTGSGAGRTSSSAIDVYYNKDATHRGNRAEITLRHRESGDRILHTIPILDTSDSGNVTIPAGIAITNEDHHYELEMIFFNRNGVAFGGLGRARPVIRFEVCRLEPAPAGVHLLFAKAIYAEGVDAGEFPYIRDLVYNRIDWVGSTCARDGNDFGTDISSVLNKRQPVQFASVINNTPKFRELENELSSHSGACQYTTPPRSASPSRCRLVNAAIRAEADGDGNTHSYIFFRSDTIDPSPGRAINRWHYGGGNYYWEIRGCPMNGIVIDTATLQIRERPDGAARSIGRYSRGTNITTLCQTTGTSVDGNNTWYGTNRGGYVAGRYVHITGTGAPLDCATANFPPPSSP